MGILRRYPAFRSLWIGQLFSQLGNAVFLIMGLWEIQLRSPALLAAAGIAMVLPTLLAAGGGVIVDRYDAGRIMLWTDILRGVAVALGLAALLIPGSLVPDVIALLAVNSLGVALFGPAEAIMVPRLVGDDDLSAANGVYSLTNQIASAVGSAIGGAAIAAVGAAWVFGFDTGSFWVSALAISLMLRVVLRGAKAPSASAAPTAPQVSFGASMREGFAAIRKLPAVIELLPIILLVNFAFMAAFTMLPYWIHHVLHASAFWYGLIDAGWAAGAIIGSLSTGYFGRMSTRNVATVMFGVMALLFGAFALSGSTVLSGALLLLAGIANSVGNAVMFTLFQRIIPAEVRGRAFGLIFTIFGLASPLGSLAAGVFLHLLPLYWSWVLGVIAGLALAIGLWRLVPANLGTAQEPAASAD